MLTWRLGSIYIQWALLKTEPATFKEKKAINNWTKDTYMNWNDFEVCGNFIQFSDNNFAFFTSLKLKKISNSQCCNMARHEEITWPKKSYPKEIYLRLSCKCQNLRAKWIEIRQAGCERGLCRTQIKDQGLEFILYPPHPYKVL